MNTRSHHEVPEDHEGVLRMGINRVPEHFIPPRPVPMNRDQDPFHQDNRNEEYYVRKALVLLVEIPAPHDSTQFTFQPIASCSIVLIYNS